MSSQNSSNLSAPFIKATLEFRDYKTLRILFKEKEIADIAEIFSNLELNECIALIRLVPRVRRAALFSHLSIDKQSELLEELPDVITSALLNEMEPDDRTHLLEEIEPTLRNRLLLKLNPEERQVAWKLLSYPENSVGRLMTPDFLALHGKMTVREALESIHWSTTLPVEYLNYLFVTEDSGRLVGEVSLASLVVCDPPSKPISEIMKKSYVCLNPAQQEYDAVEIFRKYDTNYIPVVDDRRHLLGIVTADDVFDVAEEEATEDIHQFGGQDALEDSYFQTPFRTLFQKRAGWLSFLFISGFFSGEALGHFHDTISTWPFLVIFLPPLLAAGGNSGTQSASLIVRGFAIQEMGSGDVWRVLKRESLVGLALGIFMSALSLLRIGFTWGSQLKISIIIGTSVIFVVLCGVIIGSMLPFLFRKFKMDPAVASSPFISTFVDISGILILLNIATYVMENF